MCGCSQQAFNRDVSHATDNKQRIDRFSNSRASSTIPTTPTAAVVQTPRFNGTKRRRLYGLNSRFDRMLQEVAWASRASNPTLPSRKRAYSSNSLSTTNHDLSKTPTEIEYGSTRLEKSIVSTMPESWLPEATLFGNAYLSPPQVGKTGDLALMGSFPKLPEWLNNTLATLPPDNAVRCLTLPPDHLTQKDHIDWTPDASEEGSVFAFQAPADGYHPEDHTKTEGQLRADLATFRIAHDECVGFHGCCPTTPLACAASLSTPGPGSMTSQVSASCRPRKPSSALRFSLPTGTSTTKVSDASLPFSTPGPFVPARPTYGHALDRGPTAQRELAYDTVLPVAGWNDQRRDEDFRELFSSSPKFVFDDVAGPLSFIESVPPVDYSGSPTENLSFSPTPWTAPTCAADRLMATTPRSLTWGSPIAVTRPSSTVDSISRRKPAVYLSDIQLDEKASYESLPRFDRSQGLSTSMSVPVTPPPPPFSEHLPTNFGWISPNASPTDVLGRVESVHGTNID